MPQRMTQPGRHPIVEKDVVYKTIGLERLRLDVCRLPDRKSRANPKQPALVIIHGGGFESGTKDKPELQGLARHMSRLGYVVFVINYRLAPEYRYIEMVSDVKTAVQWIRSRADFYGVDPDRIGAWGVSAGSYLTAMLALHPDPPEDSPAKLAHFSHKIQCAVIKYGVFDLPEFLVRPHARKQIQNLLGKAYEQAPDLWRKASPITYTDQKAPPLYLVHGTADTAVPVDQSRQFYRALKRKKAEVHYLQLEGAGHGWRPNSDFGRRENAEVTRFLAEHLNPVPVRRQ